MQATAILQDPTRDAAAAHDLVQAAVGALHAAVSKDGAMARCVERADRTSRSLVVEQGPDGQALLRVPATVEGPSSGTVQVVSGPARGRRQLEVQTPPWGASVGAFVGAQY